MIQCSNCNQSLPDWAKSCQFCGNDVSSVQRPAAPGKPQRAPVSATPGWIWPVYYALCAYWVISGLGGAADSYRTAITPVKMEMFGIKETIEAPGFGSFGFILGITIATFKILVGIGLAARVEIARGIANFLAGLSILFGLIGLAGSAVGTLVAGAFGVLMMFLNVLDIVNGGLTIYLIGETEKHAPNI